MGGTLYKLIMKLIEYRYFPKNSSTVSLEEFLSEFLGGGFNSTVQEEVHRRQTYDPAMRGHKSGSH